MNSNSQVVGSQQLRHTADVKQGRQLWSHTGKYLSVVPMAQCVWTCVRHNGSNRNILHACSTSTSPTPAQILQHRPRLARLDHWLYLKYLSRMPMRLDMCPAQWIQLENTACLLSIHVPITGTHYRQCLSHRRNNSNQPRAY
jgi:hypothetical protein